MNSKKIILASLTALLILVATILMIEINTIPAESQHVPSVNLISESTEKENSSQSMTPYIESSNDILVFALIILSLTTLLSVAISFYLYKWRRILLANPNTVVPEEWAKSLMVMGDNINKINSSVNNSLNSVSEEAASSTQKINQMTETYMELQSVLDEKDQEIKRLRTGYDAEIFKRFISRFIRIEQSLDDFIQDEGEKESYTFLKRLFEDALEECGVCKFEPQVGEDYRKAVGISDNPKREATTDKEKDFQISEVIEAGYHTISGEIKHIIIPAKVRIFRLG